MRLKTTQLLRSGFARHFLPRIALGKRLAGFEAGTGDGEEKGKPPRCLGETRSIAFRFGWRFPG
jgi:hypothetical protein